MPYLQIREEKDYHEETALLESLKFAMGDEEINYGLYKPDAATGHEALEILQTPILEAFTNNASSMHSFLQTYTNNQTLLYLPVMKLNTIMDGAELNTTFNTFMVAVDQNTTCALGQATVSGAPPAGWNLASSGILNGWNPSKGFNTKIRIDQGIDNEEIPPGTGLPSGEFYENLYLVQMDNRLGKLYSGGAKGTQAMPSFIDDDNIAAYYLSQAANKQFVGNNTNTQSGISTGQVIAGARGSILQCKIQATINLQQGSSWFDRLGSTFDAQAPGGASVNCYYIDTVMRVTGLTTGYELSVPIRYVKAVDAYNCGS